MKVIPFEGNTPSCSFDYFRVREGPNYFVSHYKGSTRGHNDPKECWRVLGTAKFTASGQALKAWCLLMDEEYNKPIPSSVDEFRGSGRKDTSFASDVDDETPLEEPTNNTKMIV